MFDKDMTVPKFIIALEDYNTKILQHIAEGTDFSYLIDEFNNCNFMEKEDYRNALFVYQMNQEEYYLKDINITNEMMLLLNEDIFQNNPDTYNKLLEIDANRYVSYACCLSNYKNEFTAYVDWVDHVDDFFNTVTATVQKEREELIKEYRSLCNNLYPEIKISDLKRKSKADLQFCRHFNIISAIETRGSFAPRYLVDISSDLALDNDIDVLLDKLKIQKTFSDRVKYIKDNILTQTSNKSTTFKSHNIRIENIGIGGKFGPFINTVLGKHDDLKKKYMKGTLPISEKAKEFMVLLFFYLSLPIEEFTSFMEYEGYSIHPTLPILNVGENEHFFLQDLESLCNAGLSYNTVLAILYGNSTYQKREN